jgi:hypothetical protein
VAFRVWPFCKPSRLQWPFSLVFYVLRKLNSHIPHSRFLQAEFESPRERDDYRLHRIYTQNCFFTPFHCMIQGRLQTIRQYRVVVSSNHDDQVVRKPITSLHCSVNLSITNDHIFFCKWNQYFPYFIMVESQNQKPCRFRFFLDQ